MELGRGAKNVIYATVKFFLNIWYKLYYKDRNIFCKHIHVIVLCKIYPHLIKFLLNAQILHLNRYNDLNMHTSTTQCYLKNKFLTFVKTIYVHVCRHKTLSHDPEIQRLHFAVLFVTFMLTGYGRTFLFVFISFRLQKKQLEN